MTRQTISLDKKLSEYILRVGCNENGILEKLRKETAQHSLAKMQVAPEQARLLAWLASLIGAHRYLEIGVFTGYSSLAVALAMPENGEIVACDIEKNFTQIAKKYWHEAGIESKVNLLLQPALISLNQLIEQKQQGSFDLAFIDADKPNIPNYYEQCLHLVRRGGIIAIDNVLLGSRVLNPQKNDPPSVNILCEFNSKISSDSRVMHVTLPIGDGLTLLQKI